MSNGSSVRFDYCCIASGLSYVLINRALNPFPLMYKSQEQTLYSTDFKETTMQTQTNVQPKLNHGLYSLVKYVLGHPVMCSFFKHYLLSNIDFAPFVNYINFLSVVNEFNSLSQRYLRESTSHSSKEQSSNLKALRKFYLNILSDYITPGSMHELKIFTHQNFSQQNGFEFWTGVTSLSMNYQNSSSSSNSTLSLSNNTATTSTAVSSTIPLANFNYKDFFNSIRENLLSNDYKTVDPYIFRPLKQTCVAILEPFIESFFYSCSFDPEAWLNSITNFKKHRQSYSILLQTKSKQNTTTNKSGSSSPHLSPSPSTHTATHSDSAFPEKKLAKSIPTKRKSSSAKRLLNGIGFGSLRDKSVRTDILERTPKGGADKNNGTVGTSEVLTLQENGIDSDGSDSKRTLASNNVPKSSKRKHLSHPSTRRKHESSSKSPTTGSKHSTMQSKNDCIEGSSAFPSLSVLKSERSPPNNEHEPVSPKTKTDCVESKKSRPNSPHQTGGGTTKKLNSSREQNFELKLPAIQGVLPVSISSMFDENLSTSIKQADHITIIGGDLLALEMASELNAQFPNKTIVVLHSQRNVLNSMSENVRSVVLSHFKNREIQVLTKMHLIATLPMRITYKVKTSPQHHSPTTSGNSPTEFSSSNNQEIITKEIFYILLEDGSILETDKVLVCNYDNTQGNTQFLIPNFSSHIDKRGFAIVDQYLRFGGTSNIFALGDVAALNEYKIAERARAHSSLVTANLVHLLQGLELVPYRNRDLPKRYELHLGPNNAVQMENGQFVRIGSAPAERRAFTERRVMHRLGALSIALQADWAHLVGLSPTQVQIKPSEDETAGSRGDTSSEATRSKRVKEHKDSSTRTLPKNKNTAEERGGSMALADEEDSQEIPTRSKYTRASRT